MDAWTRLLTHQGLPLVPFVWRDLKVRGAWRLDPRAPAIFLVRRNDPLMDVLLARAAVPGPHFVVVESGRGLWSLRWLADRARCVPFGSFGGREAKAAREHALDECAHKLAEGISSVLIAGDGIWLGERVESLEEYAAKLLDRCADLALAPRVVPLRFAYPPPGLAPGTATIIVGDPQPGGRRAGAAGMARLTPALDATGSSEIALRDLETLAGLAALAVGEGDDADAPRPLPAGFEGRVQAAKLNRPLEVRELVRAAGAYQEALAGVGATDRQVRRAGWFSLSLRASIRGLLTLAGAVPALYGILANAAPLAVSGLFARSSPAPGTPSPVQSRLLAGAGVLFPYYAAAGMLLFEALGAWRGFALLLSLPATGGWALIYWGLGRSFLRGAWRLRQAPLRGGVAADLGSLRGEVEAALVPLADLYEPDTP